MRIVFVSNYFNHHQKPLCDALYSSLNKEFVFISTSEMREERRKLGYGMKDVPGYVKLSYLSPEIREECRRDILAADVVIYGSTPEELIVPRLKAGRLTFKYSERIYKKECKLYSLPARAIKYYMQWGRYKSLYLLAAGAYAASDYAKTGTFKGRAYKWGYFPEAKKYCNEFLMNKKAENAEINLLWAGRMIDWKHPELALEIAERLKGDGIDFVLNIIGNGVMEDELRRLTNDKGLDRYVNFLGAMKPEAVREHMEKADIFLFTSNRQEGWGAVLNEAMNSGCAVVASDAIGSVGFLLEQGKNGFIYEDGNISEAFGYVKLLSENRELRNQLGSEAYKTVIEVWNAESAAKRLISLSELLQSNNHCELYDNGPCSRV